MARQKQIDTLRQGTEKWNIWRQKYPRTKIDLSGAHLIGANLRDANLIGANFRDATLSNADLSGATLSGATLIGADLIGATLSGADLIRANLIEADLSRADLSFANLSGANLSRADLSGATLIRATLRNADLSRATLSGATLSGANLSGANLSGATLSGATLRNADLIGATLSGADLSRADLRNADLSEATVGRTVFGDVDLRTIKNLETVQHNAPSYISTSTLSRSQGDIPDIFLRGAGLDDTFIEYVRSLTTRPIEYYTCFISYSSKDDQFARRLHNDLQQEGVRCWFAPEDMDIGDKIRHRIDESIRLYDKLLLILSEHSIASNWVEYEVERAVNKEPQGNPNVLYPVRVDKAIMICTKTWAHDIKSTRHIGDFENWTEPQQYEKSFKRLLRALNTKKEPKKV